MKNVEILLDGNILNISKKRARRLEKDVKYVDLKTLKENKIYNYKLKSIEENEINQILILDKVYIPKEMEDEKINQQQQNYNDLVKTETENEVKSEDDYKYLLVYTTNKSIKYILANNEEKLYKKLVKLRYKVIKTKLTNNKVSFHVLAYIVNKYNFPISEINFQIGDCLKRKCYLKQFPTKISKIRMLLGKMIYKYTFSTKEIINDDTFINGAVKFTIKINDVDVNYQIGKKKKHIKNKKDYYIPMMSKYVKDFAIHIRRTMRGNLILVRRPKEPIEYTCKFKFLESKFISRIFYYISKLTPKIKKINLFYEKFSEKAEEGTFELCKRSQSSKKTKNYFIIDKTSDYYDEIKKYKFVVPKYSLKYYWLIYNAKTFIATETQMHANILRSNNKYLRKNINKKKFVFLQHGIIFMKNLGKNSTFIKGREAEPTYMVVSSEYEKEVVEDMLNLPEERLLKTGLALYSKFDFKHINNNSEDFVTIMLTWKPYEEFLTNFEESTYYQNVVMLFNMLNKYIDKEKIRIVAHPKVYDLLETTDLADIIWKEPIFDCMLSTKLLITDYSSICYNAFYQGAGVIFYQPDLEYYEEQNGELIPSDDEYIGYRAFSPEEMEELIIKSIKNGKIDLPQLRTKQFEEMYSKINEFSDGKNIERIFEKLKDVEII